MNILDLMFDVIVFSLMKAKMIRSCISKANFYFKNNKIYIYIQFSDINILIKFKKKKKEKKEDEDVFGVIFLNISFTNPPLNPHVI
jgi:putative ribosome biogenesis GTPase RsgA